jgi:hypothetical protein
VHAVALRSAVKADNSSQTDEEQLFLAVSVWVWGLCACVSEFACQPLVVRQATALTSLHSLQVDQRWHSRRELVIIKVLSWANATV